MLVGERITRGGEVDASSHPRPTLFVIFTFSRSGRVFSLLWRPFGDGSHSRRKIFPLSRLAEKRPFRSQDQRFEMKPIEQFTAYNQ
jgi:hypothetical protein